MQKSYECEVGAATLADVPAGESPAGGTRSVATVVISSDGKGDRPVESLEVKATVGWGNTRSDPPGWQATWQAVVSSEPVKPRKFVPPATEGMEGRGLAQREPAPTKRVPDTGPGRRAQRVGAGTSSSKAG
jgi:hypothetical protein